jgi:L-2,4-diaminobutyrate decarboxylase
MSSILERAYDAQDFRDAGHALVDALADYLDLVKQRSPEKAIEWVAPETATDTWKERMKEGAGGDPLALFQPHAFLPRTPEFADPIDPN